MAGGETGRHGRQRHVDHTTGLVAWRSLEGRRKKARRRFCLFCLGGEFQKFEGLPQPQWQACQRLQDTPLPHACLPACQPRLLKGRTPQQRTPDGMDACPACLPFLCCSHACRPACCAPACLQPATAMPCACCLCHAKQHSLPSPCHALPCPTPALRGEGAV